MNSIVTLAANGAAMSSDNAQILIRMAIMAARRQGITLADIETEFGRSYRTAQRLAALLQSTFPAIDRDLDDDGRTVRLRLPHSAIQALLFPTADELVALTAAIDHLRDTELDAEAEHLRSLDHKFRALIPAGTSRKLAPDEDALLEALGHAARPGPRPGAKADVNSAISEALKGPNLLRITYRGRKDASSKERIVAPFGLLLGIRRYLVARDTAKPSGNLRHYRVDDIEHAEVLGESFVPDPAFTIRAHAERAFGSYVDDNEHGEVVWRFAPHAAEDARRYIFHPTQMVEDEEDGSLTVRFKASGHVEMCWHLYAWGDAVEVLAPKRLQELVADHRRSDFPSLP